MSADVLGCFASIPLTGKTALCLKCPMFNPCMRIAYENLLKIRNSLNMESEVRRLQLMRVRAGLPLYSGPADVGKNFPLTDAQEAFLNNDLPTPLRDMAKALWVRGLDARLMRAHLREKIHPMLDMRGPPAILNTLHDLLTDALTGDPIPWANDGSINKSESARLRAAKLTLAQLKVLQITNGALTLYD